LGCGANLAKQFFAINNTGHKLATVHFSIVNLAVVDISIVDFTRPVDDSRHQLNDYPNHHDPNHADLIR